jgi:hypothetical protein
VRTGGIGIRLAHEAPAEIRQAPLDHPDRAEALEREEGDQRDPGHGERPQDPAGQGRGGVPRHLGQQDGAEEREERLRARLDQEVGQDRGGGEPPP